jgi:hypothetical protein
MKIDEIEKLYKTGITKSIVEYVKSKIDPEYEAQQSTPSEAECVQVKETVAPSPESAAEKKPEEFQEPAETMPESSGEKPAHVPEPAMNAAKSDAEEVKKQAPATQSIKSNKKTVKNAKSKIQEQNVAKTSDEKRSQESTASQSSTETPPTNESSPIGAIDSQKITLDSSNEVAETSKSSEKGDLMKKVDFLLRKHKPLEEIFKLIDVSNFQVRSTFPNNETKTFYCRQRITPRIQISFAILLALSSKHTTV